MQKIIILDFGSQTTQLIGRRIRELNTFCEIMPYNKFPQDDPDVIGVILSGSPLSCYAADSLHPDFSAFRGKYPILGICYGAQLMANTFGGKVEPEGTREYGRANLTTIDFSDPLFKGFDENSQVWMSHGDTITALPEGAKLIASTPTVKNAAYFIDLSESSENSESSESSENSEVSESSKNSKNIWGVQFHPEVFHSIQGTLLLKNFVVDICGGKQDWSPDSFVETTVQELRQQVGDDKVILGLSGGVDSSVAAVLLNKAIGKNLTCIFVNNGLLRKNEFTDVLRDYECLGLNVVGVDASQKFYTELAGVSEPEKKRKIIGKGFIDVFEAEARKIEGAKWLAQGTIYPDRIESLNITGKVIKSHHNVGGLPEKMGLKLCEPLKWLFKDEVRRVGRSMGMPEHLITRHPFPGPGLAVRILGDITPEKVRVLQDADDIYIRGLREWKVKLIGEEARKVLAAGVPAHWQKAESEDNSQLSIINSQYIEVSLYDMVWQAGAILLSEVKSVGVMGDERTYENPVALRAVTSADAMTADWAKLPYEFLAKVSNDIINNVRGVNRVCYDVSSKPPATIEWE